MFAKSMYVTRIAETQAITASNSTFVRNRDDASRCGARPKERCVGIVARDDRPSFANLWANESVCLAKKDGDAFGT